MPHATTFDTFRPSLDEARLYEQEWRQSQEFWNCQQIKQLDIMLRRASLRYFLIMQISN